MRRSVSSLSLDCTTNNLLSRGGQSAHLLRATDIVTCPCLLEQYKLSCTKQAIHTGRCVHPDHHLSSRIHREATTPRPSLPMKQYELRNDVAVIQLVAYPVRNTALRVKARPTGRCHRTENTSPALVHVSTYIPSCSRQDEAAFSRLRWQANDFADAGRVLRPCGPLAQRVRLLGQWSEQRRRNPEAEMRLTVRVSRTANLLRPQFDKLQEGRELDRLSWSCSRTVFRNGGSVHCGGTG